jgi:hypothetical protein
MSRFVIMALAALVSVQVGTARASTFTYDLTLSALSGPESGTGTLLVNGTNGTFSSNAGTLDYLDININGQNYTLANAIGNSAATFVNGALTSLNYLGIAAGTNLSLAATAGLFYIYADLSNSSLSSVGTISAVDPGGGVGAAPLPTTILLFAAGLLGLVLVAYRQKLSAASKPV